MRSWRFNVPVPSQPGGQLAQATEGILSSAMNGSIRLVRKLDCLELHTLSP